MQTTEVQRAVVAARIKDGYIVDGATESIANGLLAVMLSKKNHTMVINTLGYDEHFKGKTWRISEYNEYQESTGV